MVLKKHPARYRQQATSFACLKRVHQTRHDIARYARSSAHSRKYVNTFSLRSLRRMRDYCRLKPPSRPFGSYRRYQNKKPAFWRASYFGTPGTIRTCDTWFRRPVLYPLSYGCVTSREGLTPPPRFEMNSKLRLLPLKPALTLGINRWKRM